MNKKALRHFIDLLISMTEKEVKARYKYTLLGFLWMIINPLLQMVVIGFIFAFFIKETVDHYFFFLFIGLLVWNFFSLSLSKSTPSIVYERLLIKKAKFPRSVIPLSIILANFFHLLIGLGLFLFVLFVIRIPSLFQFLAIIPTLFFLLLFTIGVSFVTTALNVKYRDVNFFVQAVLIIWFYATPIIYPLSFVPTHLQWMWDLNPLSTGIRILHALFLNTPLPEIHSLIISAGMIFFIVIIGTILFQKESSYFDDWI